MRSSIACVRCRRSKVKCVNSGVGTICRSCENSGRECTYPSPISSSTLRRRESVSGRDAPTIENEHRRSRHRKSTHGSSLHASSLASLRESPRPALDALDPKLLTPTVWQELFDIFQLHFSADLPFLHPTTFLEPLRPGPPLGNLNVPSSVDASMQPPSRPPGSPELLLAFLALTSRFHPKLVAHHSPPSYQRTSRPIVAAEYYAAAANSYLDQSWRQNMPPSLDRVQALLMIGLHEWGMCRGGKAWLTIGMAVRMAQAMGLQYEKDLDDVPHSLSAALRCEAHQMGLVRGQGVELGVDDDSADLDPKAVEIRRRTFWSCFIMDRYMSSGKYRPQMISTQNIRIQLPSSEQSFLFGEKVQTSMLGEEDKSGPSRKELREVRSFLLRENKPGADHVMTDARDEKVEIETGSSEGLVSRFVKMLEIYGKVIRWSCAGGRRKEMYAPWDEKSKFHQLRKECWDFKKSLPRLHDLSQRNIRAHIDQKTSTPYTLVHIAYLLCQIILNREYVPFLPLRCKGPEGPLDEPTFPPASAPPNFWLESARDCFRASRDIMDLVRACREWQKLPETPMVGFAIYTVAFTGIYCINFPWMDTEGHMSRNENNFGDLTGYEAAKRGFELIQHMQPRLRMGGGWFLIIRNMHRYLRGVKKDYSRHRAAEDPDFDNPNVPDSPRRRSLREGGIGGGLDEYLLLERVLKEFGKLDDYDIEMTDNEQQTEGPIEQEAEQRTEQQAQQHPEQRSEQRSEQHPGQHPEQRLEQQTEQKNEQRMSVSHKDDSSPDANTSRFKSEELHRFGPRSEHSHTEAKLPWQAINVPHGPPTAPATNTSAPGGWRPLPHTSPGGLSHIISNFRPSEPSREYPGGGSGSPNFPTPPSQGVSSPSQLSSHYDSRSWGEKSSTYATSHGTAGGGSTASPYSPHESTPGHSTPGASGPAPSGPTSSGFMTSPPNTSNHYTSPPNTSNHYTSPPNHSVHIKSPPNTSSHMMSSPMAGGHMISPPVPSGPMPPHAPYSTAPVPMETKSAPAQAGSKDQKDCSNDFIKGLRVEMGGEDVAIFVDGGDLIDWRNQPKNFLRGWLNAIWIRDKSDLD